MSSNRGTSASYSVLRFIARRIPPSVLRVKAVDVMVLPRKRWRPPTESTAIRWANPDDIRRLEDLSFRPPGVDARLARGGRAVVWVERDQIVGCLWFEPSAPVYEDWLHFLLTDAQRWISDSYVAPDHRGKGISAQLGHYGRAHLPAGVTSVVAVTTFLNAASRRSAEKSGYDITRIWYVRVLGFTVVKLPQRWRIGWWRSSRPLQLPLTEITPGAARSQRASGCSKVHVRGGT